MRLLPTAAVLLGLLFVPSAGAAQRVPFGFFGVSVDGALFRHDVNQSREFATMTRAGAEAITPRSTGTSCSRTPTSRRTSRAPTA